NLLLVETERQMMSCGQEVMIVADHTKFGRLALARLCGLEEVQSIVVDSGLAEGQRAMLAAAGLAIHIAPVEPGRSNGAAFEPARADGVARENDGVGGEA